MENIEKGNVILDFYSPWCGPCKDLAPIMEELKEEFKGKIEILPLNTAEDTGRSLGIKYHIRSAPSIVFLKDGEMVNLIIGLRDKETLVKEINEYF